MTAQNKQAPSLTDYIATVTLARDIATERGKNVIDLPDLLMALTLDAGKVGETLRSHGLQPKALADVEQSALQTALEQLPESTFTRVVGSSTQDRIDASYTIFLPSSPEKAWEFVSSPSNLPSWLPAIKSLDVEPGSTGPWLGRSATPPGKFSEALTKPSRQVQEVALTVKDTESKHIEYELKFPREPHLNTQRVSVQLIEDSNGCICKVSIAWLRPGGKQVGTLQRFVRKLIGLIARPAVGYFVKGQATAIARGLRQSFDKEQ